MIANIIMMQNGTAFNQNNSCCICICIASLIISGIIFVLRLIFFIEFIIAYNKVNNWIKKDLKLKASASDWAKLIIPYILFFILDILHILSTIYLYRLLKIKSSVCYRDYISNATPVNVTIANDPIMKTPQIFPNQLPPPGYPNQLPPPGYPNQLPPPGYPNQLPPPGYPNQLPQPGQQNIMN